MIKAIIFDLDDTLAPEKLFVKSGYKAVASYLADTALKGVGADEIETSLWKLFLEDSRQVFNRLYEKYDMPYDIADIKALVKIYREHRPDESVYRYYEDTFVTLVSLKEQGYRLGILSDGFLVSQENKLKALGIRKGADFIFDEIILTDEYGEDYRKPSKKGFELLAKRLLLEPSELLYVGDNPAKDFYVKTQLPVRTVRIKREDGVYLDTEYREGVREDAVISSLEELSGMFCDSEVM